MKKKKEIAKKRGKSDEWAEGYFEGYREGYNEAMIELGERAW